MDPVIGPATRLVTLSQTMGKMEPAAIFAFFCMVLLAFIWYLLRQQRKNDQVWQTIRTSEAIADSKLADGVSNMSRAFAELKVIVDERIPRAGGNHV